MTKEVGPRGMNQRVESGQLEWQPLQEPGVSGVLVKVLRFDKATGRAPTILLRFEPGATYPLHSHPGGEEVFVLEGDVHLGKDHLRTGDYLYTAPDNKHAVRSDGGCVLLLVVPEAVEILAHTKRASHESANKDEADRA
jgi:quercetin dioxygenase-like cupin family protein